MPQSSRTLLLAAVLAALVAALYPVHRNLRRSTEDRGEIAPAPAVEAGAGEEVLAWAMGWAIAGFRQVGVAVDVGHASYQIVTSSTCHHQPQQGLI